MMNAFTALLALASAANAHMIMKTPKPALSPNNSPLDASGSDFPCKIPGGSGTIPSTDSNVIVVGASNTLSFTGSAVHGGGSCQVSLAKGNTVSKDTKWMVIHSIEGGCPANVAQNLPPDANGSGAATFQFTVPDHPDLAPGTYTLAWTWHNKVGNREMYMNCASVDLQAAKKKRYMPTPRISTRDQAPLPAMFVANIGNGCTVAENIDLKYPNPGSSLEVGQGAALGSPTGNCGATGSQPDTSSPSSASSPSGAASSTAVSNTVQPIASPSNSAGAGFPGFPGAPGAPSGAPSGASSVAPTASGYNGRPSGTSASGPQRTQSDGGSFVTASAPAGGAQSSAAAVSTAAPVASSAAAPSAAPSAAPIQSPPAAAGACTAGYWMCAADGKSFTRCVAGGTWSVAIQMAAGTACVPSSGSGSATLEYASIAGTHAKRDIRAHIARRAHGMHGSLIS